MLFTVKRISITPASGMDSGKLRLSLDLETDYTEDMPGVAKAKLCGLEAVEFDPPRMLPMGFSQPSVDTGKGKMRLTVSVVADHPDRYEEGDERIAAASVEWGELCGIRLWAEGSWVAGDEVKATLTWAEPVREPELFGGTP